MDNIGPPPPYTPPLGLDDDTGTRVQQLHKSSSSANKQQGKHTTGRGTPITWLGLTVRRLAAQVLHQTPQQHVPNGGMRRLLPAPPPAAVEDNIMDISKIFPRWNGHNGMACGEGAMLTKLPPPTMPSVLVCSYSLHVLCRPPPPTVETVAPRWQQTRLVFFSDNLPEILRAPPIQWRGILDDCCSEDEVQFVHCPYYYHAIPSFTDHGENPQARATPCVMSEELGFTYERTIRLGLVCDRNDRCYWELKLILTSRDGEWLASLSRHDTASFISLDSIAR